jgi:hypothetical protein
MVDAPVINHVTGDVITAAHINAIKEYLEDGTYRINSLSLCINGVSSSVPIIDTSGYAKPVRVVARDSSGILFYASDGITQIALLDESGNLFIKGSVGSL